MARRLPGSSWPSPSGSGSPCSLPTWPRRWLRDVAKRRPLSLRRARREIQAKRLAEAAPWSSVHPGPKHHTPQGGSGAGRGRRPHPQRRGGHGGHRHGRRERHHRRKRAGDPRKRRRPQRRHRRDARPFRLADRAHHLQSRRDLPGPHDRHGGKRQTAKDAERDRPEHPALGPDDRLPPGLRHACCPSHCTASAQPAKGRRSP